MPHACSFAPLSRRDTPLLDTFDRFIRRDPARRGLISAEDRFGPICPGHLAGAAEHLARSGQRVLIVTGFFIPGAHPPAAETDGPPGALLLAHTLHRAGIETFVTTDPLCRPALCAAADAQGLPPDRVVCYPAEFARSANAPDAPDPSHANFTASLPDLTHIVAIERVGPSHTPDSLVRQPRTGSAPVDRFLQSVPAEHRDRCHNMRGEIIDAWSGEVHRLFEVAKRLFPAAATIGIGDGGNEIGMGAVPWEDLARRLTGEQAGWLPCRIPCDWNIVAGVSNWGAYALAAAFAHIRGQPELLRPFDAGQQQHVIETMVEHGPAVDGATRLREPTVDGLPFLTYIQPWIGIRQKLGLPD